MGRSRVIQLIESTQMGSRLVDKFYEWYSSLMVIVIAVRDDMKADEEEDKENEVRKYSQFNTSTFFYSTFMYL